MFESKKELLEEKLEKEREDFYKKGKILINNNESIKALKEYKDSCIEFFKTRKELEELEEQERQREEELREKIRQRPKYKVAKYWLDTFENFIDKCEKTFSKTK